MAMFNSTQTLFYWYCCLFVIKYIMAMFDDIWQHSNLLHWTTIYLLFINICSPVLSSLWSVMAMFDSAQTLFYWYCCLKVHNGHVWWHLTASKPASTETTIYLLMKICSLVLLSFWSVMAMFDSTQTLFYWQRHLFVKYTMAMFDDIWQHPNLLPLRLPFIYLSKSAHWYCHLFGV